jgi:integrase
LHKQITRHGRTVWYVRVGHGQRIRITAEYGTPDFHCQYLDAIAGKLRPVEKGPMAGSVAWAIGQYRESSAWLALKPATRRQRENIFEQIVATAGNQPLARVDRRAIIAGRERRAATPFQAKHFVAALRGLFAWALDNDHVKTDPTADIKVKKPKTDGFPPWTESEIAKFESHWSVGTRERLVFDLCLYTGLRRGDVARLGRQHVSNGIIAIDTEKTSTRVTIPILPELARSIEAAPTGDLTFVVGLDGKPMTKEGMANAFREACRAAGISKSMHGLRKSAATRAANAGATVAQLEAIFGWSGGRMASLYTRAADREHLARTAMDKLRNKP